MPVFIEEEEDWTRITDPKLRKRVQNRVHQRKHRLMIRRQQTDYLLEDGMPDLQAGSEPRSTSEPNTPTLAIYTPTSSTPRGLSYASFSENPMDDQTLQLPSIDEFSDLQSPMQRMEEPINSWTYTAGNGSDEVGDSDLETMAMGSWMFPLSQDPIQAPPQPASPRSINSPSGGYQAADGIPTAANIPQWNVVGMQELSPSPLGHQSPLVAESRTDSRPVCPSPSTAFSPQNQGTRTKDMQAGLYQPAATSPTATSAAQWRVIGMLEHEEFPRSHQSPPLRAAIPDALVHPQGWDLPPQPMNDPSRLTPPQETVHTETVRKPNIEYAHRGCCSQCGHREADRAPQERNVIRRSVVCCPQRPDAYDAGQALTEHQQTVSHDSGVAYDQHQQTLSHDRDAICCQHHGVTMSPAIPLRAQGTRFPQSNRHISAFHTLPRKTYPGQMPALACCHCGGHEKGPHHGRQHAQMGEPEIKAVMVYLQSVNKQY